MTKEEAKKRRKKEEKKRGAARTKLNITPPTDELQIANC